MIKDDYLFNGIKDKRRWDLINLRRERKWTQGQVALVLKVELDYYINLECGEVENPEIEAKAKDILQNQLYFSPYFLIPVPDFKPTCEYVFKAPIKKHGTVKKYYKFLKPAKGAHGITHYLFKNKGGSIKSFSELQLMDYSIREA